jgi:hypothetical protein
MWPSASSCPAAPGAQRRPDHDRHAARGSDRRLRLLAGAAANHTNNTVFMKPNAYAGDNGQPEQRVGQIGFRIVF